ncbi:Na+/H+ antiporter subunit E [Tessaracoccus sp. MC1756]|uniref:Na+/H+ antiporter subunit E n=1 Tax=Tessaracoccus sp. MC1756 TaxID=2760311 RepID=UPI001602BBC2|nr:Na+/H+ antiporter subunit E [Tessaracoccus sp. MC1756]MBB1510351.1 Na+/H+ antiporter subunit E [Tessaracoccus sp. MC1756]
MIARSRVPLAERLTFRPLSVLSMATVWVLLWGSVSPMIIVSGLLLGYVVGIVLPLPPVFWKGHLRPVGILRLIGHLVYDLVVSSIRVFLLAFHRKVDLRAGIVRIDLITDNDLYQVQVAEMISLVPGTVVVEVVRNPRRLYLHAIQLHGDDPIGRVQKMAVGVESRVVRAFGSRREIEDFHAALHHHPAPDALDLEVEP